MAYNNDAIIFQEDKMFNREQVSVKADEQTEEVIVVEDAASEEAVEVAPAIVEESVVVEQPAVEKPAAKAHISNNSNEYPGIKTLSVGAENASVRKVQNKLSEKGFSVSATGKYDRATENAVAAFCKSKQVHSDGTFVGPKVWNHLFG